MTGLWTFFCTIFSCKATCTLKVSSGHISTEVKSKTHPTIKHTATVASKIMHQTMSDLRRRIRWQVRWASRQFKVASSLSQAAFWNRKWARWSWDMGNSSRWVHRMSHTLPNSLEWRHIVHGAPSTGGSRWSSWWWCQRGVWGQVWGGLTEFFAILYLTLNLPLNWN